MEVSMLDGETEKNCSCHYDMIGTSQGMQFVFKLLDKIIHTDATVLVHGETGSGKELIAQALHRFGSRRDGNLVVQNCAALPEHLLESELFGYKRGAFSGANTDKMGLIEQADGGTLFLDEIGDMPLELQAKLLRVLQQKEIRPVGGLRSKPVNIRIVAATHCDLERKIQDGQFRQDLYYRLSVFPVKLPALRDRSEDIPVLINHFLEEFAKQYAKSIRGLSPMAMNCLMSYNYPGNVRELRNIVERCVILCEPEKEIQAEYLPESLLKNTLFSSDSPQEVDLEKGRSSLREAVEAYESSAIQEKLIQCRGNQTRAAKELGIARRTLIEKINRYGISRSAVRLAGQSRF